MKRKTLFVIGIVLVSGVVLAAVAVAQNTTEKPKSDHECTPEMMENMVSKKDMANTCAPEMMTSGNCEMTDTTMAGCSSMMVDTTNQPESNHCSNMDSGMNSMMEESAVKTKVMA